MIKTLTSVLLLISSIPLIANMNEIQNEIFNKIKSEEQKFLAIRNGPVALVEKWQQLLQVVLPIQLEVIKSHGYESTQLGLSKFNEECFRNAEESLVELNKQKWLFIFDKAFGITEFKAISLEQAQALISAIAKEMTSESFLTQVDDIITSLPDNASMLDRRKAILKKLFSLHMAVMSEHGFEGEVGYVQAQRAIMDYYSDPVIAREAAHAQSVVFRRAKLL